MPYMEDLEHDAMMDEVMHDDPALEWDEDPRAAMYDAMADEFASAELSVFLDAQDAEYALTINMEDPA